MPRKRRTGHRMIAGPYGDVFLRTDGTIRDQVLDGDEDHAYPNRFLAGDAWKRARSMTWAHVDREPWQAPQGARVYDGFLRTPEPPAAGSWAPVAYRRQLRSTLAAARRWRRTATGIDPTLRGELDEYEELLQDLIATVGQHRTLDAATSAWTTWAAVHRVRG